MIGHYKISPSASKAISYENNVTNNTSSLEKKKKKKVSLRVEHLNPIVCDLLINMVYCWLRNPTLYVSKFYLIIELEIQYYICQNSYLIKIVFYKNILNSNIKLIPDLLILYVIINKSIPRATVTYYM